MFGELLTAMLTPFDNNGVINTPVVSKLTKKLIKDGNDGIVLAGTTGESPNLSYEDREILYRTAREAIGEKGNIIAGTGTYSTSETIRLSKQAKDCGVDALMVVTPYYSKPSQKGIYKHFKAVSEEVDLPIIAYNIPSRTSKLIEIDTLIQIVTDTSVAGIKDAVNDIEYTKNEIEELIEKKELDVSIYSGDDKLTLDMLKLGAVGVISVAGHVVSNELRKLIDFYLTGEVDKAEKINNELGKFFDLIFKEPSPAPIKSIVTDSFEYVGSCKLPLVDVSEELKLELLDEYTRIKNLNI